MMATATILTPFVVYTHVVRDDRWYHCPFTRCYAASIEESVDIFCCYMQEKFPTLFTFQFCVQALLPRADHSGYDPLYTTLGVVVKDVRTKEWATHWDMDHD